jgi:hypothetical protein
MSSEHHSRQSFLGEDFEEICQTCVVGIAGLGGGGAHIAQQLAHVGFKRFALFDADFVARSNLNRLIGATQKDADEATPKVEVARRLILGLQPDAVVALHQAKWQDVAGALHECDLVFGCVDGFREREQLEATTRRYLIPYIDIGLDVHRVEPEPPQMAGQVILSMPGGPCMRCFGFLTEEALAREAARYGDAGPRPQVVWANGVLASTAVGLAIRVLTGWDGQGVGTCYYSYEGNTGTVIPHVRLQYAQPTCPHYPADQVGPAKFRKL